mmetsp:Transcript_106769/g.319183  ORF Transcript_106769/g.319183 Transcript_106769/m.319183 type:complete len:240 (+) Transcript_106769:65-784(+)
MYSKHFRPLLKPSACHQAPALPLSASSRSTASFQAWRRTADGSPRRRRTRAPAGSPWRSGSCGCPREPSGRRPSSPRQSSAAPPCSSRCRNGTASPCRYPAGSTWWGRGAPRRPSAAPRRRWPSGRTRRGRPRCGSRPPSTRPGRRGSECCRRRSRPAWRRRPPSSCRCSPSTRSSPCRTLPPPCPPATAGTSACPSRSASHLPPGRQGWGPRSRSAPHRRRPAQSGARVSGRQQGRSR